MKQPISIIRGTTNSFSVSIKNTDGSDHILNAGETVRFGVKLHLASSEYLILKEITPSNSSSNDIEFTIEPSDTENLCFGCYYYDVGVQSGLQYYNIIECSEFRICNNVTTKR